MRAQSLARLRDERGGGARKGVAVRLNSNYPDSSQKQDKNKIKKLYLREQVREQRRDEAREVPL